MRRVRDIALIVLMFALVGCAARPEPVAEGQPDAGSVIEVRTDTTQPATELEDAAAEQGKTEAQAVPDAGIPAAQAAPDAGLPAARADVGASDNTTTPPEPSEPSGSVGSPSTVCSVSSTREVSLDEPTSLGTARALRDALAQAVGAQDTQGTPFRWSSRFGGTTTIAIADIEWADKALLSESNEAGCEDLRIPASIHFTTQDGTLDETADGWVRGTQFIGSFQLSGKLQQWLIDRAQQPGLGLTSIGVVLNVSLPAMLTGELNATSDTEDNELASDLYGLGKFDSSWVRDVELEAPFQPAAPIEEMCAAAEPADVSVSFSPGIADLSGKLSKVWLRCQGTSTGFPSHDGIAITATGWKHIQYREGAWIEQLGFGHEGMFEVLDTEINGPGSQQLVFWDMLPFTFASPSAELSSSATSLHLAMGGGNGSYGFDALYAASDVAVGAAQLAYTDGVRAGAEACDKAEAHLHRLGSAGGVSAALTGSWIFCSGSFRPDATGIELTGLGTYNHLAADGGVVASGLYEVIDTAGFNGAGSTQINLLDFDGPSHIMGVVLQSDAPLKLSFGLHEGRAVLSAR